MKQKNRPKIRLYVDLPLAAGAPVGLDGDETHYLRHVMRCKSGDEISLFNGREGEWAGRIDGYGKGWTSIAVERHLRAQLPENPVILIFAVIKRARSDFLVQKATELGVTRLQPVSTRRSQSERFNRDRAIAVAREAAEQSDRLSMPEVMPLLSLEKAIRAWPENATLWFCDEQAESGSFVDALLTPAVARPQDTTVAPGAPVAPVEGILIGPEGGFDPEERATLNALPFAHAVSLGSRILRAETAALAGLAVLQSVRAMVGRD